MGHCGMDLSIYSDHRRVRDRTLEARHLHLSELCVNSVAWRPAAATGSARSHVDHAVVVDAHELEAEAPLRTLDCEVRVTSDHLPRRGNMQRAPCTVK